jgi:hypothetical protein
MTRTTYLLAVVFTLTACGSSSGPGPGAGDDDDGSPDAAVARCGDGTCNADETASSCSADCASTGCGDGTCQAEETIASCPADCHTVCGDGVCDPGETASSCAADCAPAACTVADPSSCSGETVCIAGTCENAFGRNYKITIVSALFTENNAGGTAWDIAGGLPDPRATVKINGASQTTPVIDDTLAPTWNFVTPPTLIPGGTVFEIEVVDFDLVGGDDLAWSCTNDPLTADLIRAGVRCSGTGALSAAHIDITFTPN